MKKTYKNRPILTVVKLFLDKKSGKVVESRNEIQRRFFGLDWRDQKKILNAFLESGKNDRDWAYTRLLSVWDESFESKVIDLWEKFQDDRCAWVLIKYCSESYILNHIEHLSFGRNYYYICRRLASNPSFDIDKSRLSCVDYIKTISESGRIISEEEALDILFKVVCKWCLCEVPILGINDYSALQYRNIIISASDIKDISSIITCLYEMKIYEACNNFLSWDKEVKENIMESTELNELSNTICTDMQYIAEMVFIAQHYLYHALPQQYRSIKEHEFEVDLLRRRQLYKDELKKERPNKEFMEESALSLIAPF